MTTDTITKDGAIYAGTSDSGDQWLRLKFANRHGLIAGATGTGKTITLQGMAEGFSQSGVPVFMADIKGDLSGLAEKGGDNEKAKQRAEKIGFAADNTACPVMFWDLSGLQGHPIRTTVSEMGPLLLSRLLELNDTQEGVLNVAFKVADDEKLLLLDISDLKSMLTYLSENSQTIGAKYGAVAPASVAAIQRSLLVLENQGGDKFFGEPALNIADFMQTDSGGHGYVNILSAESLMQNPKVYATFLLWLLSELFEQMPEVGDLDKPKVVFFFDEAHLLFEDAPKALLQKITQLARLIRSKGIGIYFITQNPADIPDDILGQLGNRIQHALRAYTPKEQKAVKTAAEAFRPNPKFKTESVITELAVGEALVSFLSEDGSPQMVERTLIRPPLSRIAPATAPARMRALNNSPVSGKYETAINRESAYEMLLNKATIGDGSKGSILDGLFGGGGSGGRKTENSKNAESGLAQEMVKFAGGVLRSAIRQEATKFTRGLLKGMMRR